MHVFRYESFGYTSQELFMEWNEDNNVNANISLAQFAVFTSLVVPRFLPSSLFLTFYTKQPNNNCSKINLFEAFFFYHPLNL
jgi:hypothetical protein